MYDLKILVAIVVLLSTIYYWLTRKNYFEKHGIIHKRPLPFVGNSGSLLLQKISFADYIQNCYDLDKDAKYVGLYDFNVPAVVLRDPDLIKDVTVKNFDHFVDHRGFVDADQDPLFGRNLFSLRENKWREMRNLLSPAFTSSKMKAMFKLMSNCAESFADYLTDKAEKEPFTINSKDAFTRYTNDVIATCAFGVTVDSMRNPDNEFYVLGKKATTFDGFKVAKFFLIRRFPTLAKFLKLTIVEKNVEKFFIDLVQTTIDTRDREGIVRPDMIQLMMETRNNKPGEGPVLNILDMVAQAFLFFFGGFDTTSALMCFLAHQLSMYPEVQKKLQEEVDEVYERCKGDVTYEEINRMQYLDAVVNEVMRIYPIGAALDRLCTKTYELPPALPGKKPVVLQPGDSIFIPVYPLHRSAEYFTDPLEFYPERFIEDPKGTLHSPAFIPFGVGPRMCIGNRFALLETKVLIFHLIAKCKLTPGEKMILPLKLSATTFAMTVKGGFWLTLQSRNKPRIKSNGQTNEA